MANTVATHGVGDMDLWLSKGAEREATFAPFCSSYRSKYPPAKPGALG